MLEKGAAFCLTATPRPGAATTRSSMWFERPSASSRETKGHLHGASPRSGTESTPLRLEARAVRAHPADRGAAAAAPGLSGAVNLDHRRAFPPWRLRLCSARKTEIRNRKPLSGGRPSRKILPLAKNPRSGARPDTRMPVQRGYVQMRKSLLRGITMVVFLTQPYPALTPSSFAPVRFKEQVPLD